MILVTVGTQKFPFNRLLKKVDCLAAEEKICGPVIVQTGHSDYMPKHCRGEHFFPEEEFYRLIEKCDMMITHGGIGTITKGLLLRKKIVIVPRKKEYGEHVDDHQLEIGERFAKMEYAVLCRDVDHLEEAIEEAGRKKFREFRFSWTRSAEWLQHYLSTSKGQKS